MHEVIVLKLTITGPHNNNQYFQPPLPFCSPSSSILITGVPIFSSSTYNTPLKKILYVSSSQHDVRKSVVVYSTCTNAILCALFVWNAVFVHWKGFQNKHSLCMASHYLGWGTLGSRGPWSWGPKDRLMDHTFKLKTNFLKLWGVISWDEGGGGRYDLQKNDAALAPLHFFPCLGSKP